MKRNPLILFFIAAIVAVMLFAGIRMARDNRANGPAKGQLIGNLAPDFELPALDGKNLKLSDLRGKAVLLNFWATYCGPCKIEMPWFVELQKEYGPQGFQIVGVAMERQLPHPARQGIRWAELRRGQRAAHYFFLGPRRQSHRPRIRPAKPQRLRGPHQEGHEPGSGSTGSEVTRTPAFAGVLWSKSASVR